VQGEVTSNEKVREMEGRREITERHSHKTCQESKKGKKERAILISSVTVNEANVIKIISIHKN